MIDRLRKRITQSELEGGFTLIELLVVIIIIGILLAIAVPSYLGFKDRADKNASQANVRSIVPSIEAYYSDNGSYAAMSLATLQSGYDQSIDPAKYSLGALAANTYTICSDSGAFTAYKVGPAGTITVKASTDPAVPAAC
jgi:type IV pilus assembly protein PilA